MEDGGGQQELGRKMATAKALRPTGDFWEKVRGCHASVRFISKTLLALNFECWYHPLLPQTTSLVTPLHTHTHEHIHMNCSYAYIFFSLLSVCLYVLLLFISGKETSHGITIKTFMCLCIPFEAFVCLCLGVCLFACACVCVTTLLSPQPHKVCISRAT